MAPRSAEGFSLRFNNRACIEKEEMTGKEKRKHAMEKLESLGAKVHLVPWIVSRITDGAPIL